MVDDLVDTGRTAEALRKLLPKRISRLCMPSRSGAPWLDTFVTQVSQDTWIYFPWDIELQFVQPIARRKDR